MGESDYIATAAVFIVSDLKKSTQWYVDKLGFVAAELDWNETPALSVLRFGEAAIMLRQGNRKPLANRHHMPGEVIGDVYFWVRDLKEIELALQVGGVPVFAGPTRRAYGCIELMVTDPDDYLICFGKCPDVSIPAP